MAEKKDPKRSTKDRLHPNNKHRDRYDFKALIESYPRLAEYVKPNKFGDDSIVFSDPSAVKTLNTALLIHFYDLVEWDIPKGYLCPPAPGRADYIHHIADVLGGAAFGKTPTGKNIKVLDIGVGSSCIYPIIGHKEYGWSFIGSDIDKEALQSCLQIIEKNPSLKDAVELRLQSDASKMLHGILKKTERIDLCISNPPFHGSEEEARESSLRKTRNLSKKNIKEPNLNFGGKSHELWCEGGERQFVANLITESKEYATSCFWFSTLVSKQRNVKAVQSMLQEIGAESVKTVQMGQGNKSSRIIAWTFLNRTQRKKWMGERWANDESLKES